MSLARLTINALVLTKQLAKLQLPAHQRTIARWVAPTLRELRRRDRLLGPKAPEPRSGFVEWNYRAELFAFGKRLQEEFQLPLLQTAFTQRSYVLKEQDRQRELGIEVAELHMDDNTQLAQRGEYVAREYVLAFLQQTLPKVPAVGHEAFRDYLLSVPTLAHVSTHLGTKELIFDAEYPPSEQSLAHTLYAIIGALEQSSGVQRAFTFVRDFVCTQLNQRDLFELWPLEQPEQMLQSICTAQKLGTPEPRLIGDCGKNTVLAAYHVGIYCNKQLMGKGFGEDVNTAIKTATINALQKLFGITDSMRPFDFQLQVQPKALKLEQH